MWDSGGWVSWAELCARVERRAVELRAVGVERGDRVVLFLESSTELVVSIFAAWRAGAIAVPVFGDLRRRQLAHIVEDCTPRLVVTQGAKAEAAELPPERVFDVEQSRQPVRATDPAELPGGDEPALILYTSGSTGRPKGILCSHANLIAGARIVAGYVGLEAADRLLGVLPLSFDYGLNQVLSAAWVGAAYVVQRSTLPADICRALTTHEITVMAGVPPLWLSLAERFSPFLSIETPHLRAITNSGGAFPKELSALLRERKPGLRRFLMYGLSEAFRSSYLDPDLVDQNPESMGRAIPETTLCVVDEDGQSCAVGQVGQLVHTGPTVALGYWNAPEQSAAVFRPGPAEVGGARSVWSGDLVRRDEHGLLYFVGRGDQMIKTQGIRVSPEEVEEILYGSGLVDVVCVTGVADRSAGSVIEAHVVPRDPAGFEAEDLLAFCRREMPRYMVPRAIHVVARLPLTASGKFDRRALAS